MKIINSFLITLLISCSLFSCKKNEITGVDRPATPTNLSVSKGDTAVFIKWDAVAAAKSYVVVRGLKVIAKDLTTPGYTDMEAPDSTVEYRVYSVNDAGWRSYRYAFDSGYVAIPPGILPRPPAVAATTDNFRYVVLTLTGGRFALSYNIYRNGVLIASNYKEKTYIDKAAPVTDATYAVYSVNNNGVSLTSSTAVGRKAFVYNGNYEDKADGYILKPWTFVADNIGYYTEGDPTVSAGTGVGGSKSLKIVSGKAQLLYDWGGVAETGKYKISITVKKSNGGFWMVPNFSGAEHVAASGDWVTYSITTGVIQKGGSFNLKVEPYGLDPAFFDNWTIEYVGQ